MIDVVDKATRSRMMSGIKGKNTRPEVFLRQSLHGFGIRYRLGGAGLPGRPDLVLPSRRIAIFVHGCFWHKHDCRAFKWPKSNRSFWRKKIDGNAMRDKANARALQGLGWKVLVVWECQLKATNFKLPNARIKKVAEKVFSTPRLRK